MTSTRPTGIPHRKVALTAGFSLLFIALLAPFAQFGVLQNLVVPADATATANKILASEGLFRTGIAAFLMVVVVREYTEPPTDALTATGSPLLDAYFPLVDILAMVMFFLVIAKAWKQLKSIPPLVDSIAEEDQENQ